MLTWRRVPVAIRGIAFDHADWVLRSLGGGKLKSWAAGGGNNY